MWGIIEAPRAAGPTRAILAAFGVAAVAAVRVRRLGAARAASRCSTSRLFRNPRFSASSAAITLAFFALFGTIFFLTQYLQAVLGYSALEAGLRMLPVAAGLVLGGPPSARLDRARRHEGRRRRRAWA